MDERVQRLPIWAQQRITNLERHVENLKQDLNEALGDHEGTNVRLEPYGRPRGLPKDSTVEFDDGHTTYVVRLQNGGRGIYIHCGRGRLAAFSGASNTMTLVGLSRDVEALIEGREP